MPLKFNGFGLINYMSWNIKQVKTKPERATEKILKYIFLFSTACFCLANFNLKNDFSVVNNLNIIRAEKNKSKSEKYEPVKYKTENRIITAYNVGDINQCADDPCISASGDNLCELIKQGIKPCAVNDLPFGTIIEIENLGKFIVLDRKNSRYVNGEIDIAFSKNEYQKAIQFGIKKLEVKIPLE